MTFFNKKIIIFIMLFISMFSPSLAISQEKPKSKQSFQNQLEQLLSEYKEHLKNKNWQIKTDNNTIFASKVGNDFRNYDVTIISQTNIKYYIVNVKIKNGTKEKSKNFRFLQSKINKIQLRQVILPYLISGLNTGDEESSYQDYYDFIFSSGYARMHDGKEVYPEYKYGNLYFNTRVTYHPLKNSKTDQIIAHIGDYMMVDLDIKFSSPRESQNRPLPFDEFFFDFNMLLYGTNNFDQKTQTGILYGFFTSMEMYKPGLGSNIGDTGYDPHAITWDEEIYSDEPFVQFVTWRMLRYGFIQTKKADSTIYTLAADVGFGPSINSSLAANNIAGDSPEEDNLSHIFKSTNGRKENYYNSYVVPATFSFLADHFGNFRLGFDYKFYFFFPMEKENAYDILNIVKCSAGYYITENISFNSRYEYWHVKSKLEDKTESHFWNRVVFDLTYSI